MSALYAKPSQALFPTIVITNGIPVITGWAVFPVTPIVDDSIRLVDWDDEARGINPYTPVEVNHA